jgi:Kef-type K+ transport system membrane component KefB
MSLIASLTLLSALALALGMIAQRFHQPALLGYMAAGGGASCSGLRCSVGYKRHPN